MYNSITPSSLYFIFTLKHGNRFSLRHI